MDLKTTLTRQDWTRLRKLAADKGLSIGQGLVKKIKAGKRRWTDDVALEVHRATKGEIPCWVLRPDLWAPGQLPPCLANLAA